MQGNSQYLFNFVLYLLSKKCVIIIKFMGNMRILVSISFCLVLHILSGQTNPVKWSFEVTETKDGHYKLIAEAKIEKNWKIYGLEELEDGPIPTSITIEKLNGAELMGGITEEIRGKISFDEHFGLDIVSYADKARFAHTFKKTASKAEISGYVTFMCCDAKKCLPPTDVDFKLKF
jgi:hypothetical protein